MRKGDEMSDLIRRRDAISRMSDLLIMELQGQRLPTWNEVYQAMNDVPSAESERKWIPVIEALPEICQKDVRGNVTFSKQVWSCQKYGDGFFWQSIDQYTTNNGGGWLSEVPHDDPNDCCKVVAWMPLPEPWRGEE